jgi:SAM-dependent methyltransferase
LSIEEMLGAQGVAAIAGDPLLLCLLRSGPVRDVAVERTFTALRAGLLARSGKTSDDEIAFACALAAQCFSNEYVFATTPQEEDALARLKSIAANDLSPMQVAGLAMYEPLHQIAGAEALLARKWPQALEEVLTQQLREPAQERALRAAMPRLTAIDDEVSLRVQGQYEENPYPRWVRLPGQIEPVSLATYLERAFPGVPFTLPRDGETLDMLIAGCGTGRQSILLTQSLKDVRVLAIDLSLASLGYAKRRTPPVLASRIDYAQADILKLPALGRSFDVIDAAGVLHHLADPLAGWRLLLGMLRRGGLMHLGFYSETGRRDVVKARDWIAERKFAATPADIRRCRQEILATPLGSVSRFNDFYSTSECRDMLFHVQETRVTIPAIEKFIADNGLRFLGFEFDAGTLRRYRALFAERGWSLSDLARWHALETENPDTFAAMYSFWVQKN